MQRFIVIGISDSPQPFLMPEVREIIFKGTVFSGGKRHHEIVKELLPEGAQWIDITVPLDAVFEQYTAEEIIVFASGDPLFFGFANTIQRKRPEAVIRLFPTFNSLQLLAHRLVMPYHDMRIVSLTGRPWQEFDRALMEGAQKMGVLTDCEHTPAAIAQRMLEYGYDNYRMSVGEHLGNPSMEKVTTLSLPAAAKATFSLPNCLILSQPSNLKSPLQLCWLARQEISNLRSSSAGLQGKKSQPANLYSRYPFGLPDRSFALLDGREKMITKMPIRLLALQALELSCRRVFWDIGFCTGSVSIEARRLFPHLQVVAFEVRPACEALMVENSHRFGAPGIDIHIGDFLTTDISSLPRPDAVFIGGHGGKLQEMMEKVLTVLPVDGVIVMNAVVAPKVTTDSRKLWDEACATLHLQQEQPVHIQLDDHHPITILKCRKVE